MHKEFLMGNEAIAKGALAAGVNVVSGYPGTPSTEVLETVARNNRGRTYVEWSVNEKAALELAAGAAFTGARTLVTMKQVGLNVASDPLMSLAYLGIKGGMVIMVADDPGPISSQTEQDTRTFAAYSKLPCFDPSGVQEAHDLMRRAFAFSEKYKTPVIFRPTTRVCHAYASIDVPEEENYDRVDPEGFQRDSSRWVIFPKLSYMAHAAIEKRNAMLSSVLSSDTGNFILPGTDGCRLGIATHGISYAHARDAMRMLPVQPSVMKVTTPFPFPEEAAVRFMDGLDEVLCIEELDPVIERALIFVCGKYGLNVRIRGKLTGDIPSSGENTVENVLEAICSFLSVQGKNEKQRGESLPALPVRPPVLCAGCPHRASFYAVKQAMVGKKTVFCGDIGCYTLGNAMPLDMVDTCLCMGAGVNMAQGIGHVEPDRICFAFVGDSTFFASAIPGVVNAVYNQACMTLIVLDNSTTAMTGHQPHPGTGVRMMSYANGARPAEPVDVANRICMEKVLEGIGVSTIRMVNPLQLEEAVQTIKEVAEKPGVKAVIFRSPCVAIMKVEKRAVVDQNKCIGCRKCIRSLGCPALTEMNGKIMTDPMQCTGCMLCAQVCPKSAIVPEEKGC